MTQSAGTGPFSVFTPVTRPSCRGKLRHAPRQQLHAGFHAGNARSASNDGLRPVGDREHAVSALGLERAAVLLKKGPGVRRGKARQGAVEKARVRRHVQQNVLPRAVVRDVAPALAGDEQLFAEACRFARAASHARPACAAIPAAIIPAAPPPTTTILFDPFKGVIFIPKPLQILIGFCHAVLLLQPDRPR